MQNFEFSLDNSDAKYIGYCRRGLRIRFYMIVCRLFYSCTVKGTTQSLNNGVTDGGSRVRTSPWQDKCKNWVPILFIFRYSVLFWFSVSPWFFSCFGRFWTAIFWWFRVLIYRNPHPDTLSFLNVFLYVREGPYAGLYVREGPYAGQRAPSSYVSRPGQKF